MTEQNHHHEGTPVAVLFASGEGIAGMVRVIEDPAQDLAEQAAGQMDRDIHLSDDSYERICDGADEAAYFVYDLSDLSGHDLARVWGVDFPDDQEIIDLIDAKARSAGAVRAIPDDAEAAA